MGRKSARKWDIQRGSASRATIISGGVPYLDGTNIEERVKEATGLHVEMPSFVDDMCVDVIDWDGGRVIRWMSKGL